MKNVRVVAIVDDEPVSCMLLGHVLRANQLATRVFSAPEEFLVYMKGNRPDCVLLDLNMPGMNGLEVLTRLKAMGSTSPVIVVTAEADVATAGATFMHGAVNFVTKPIDPAEVLSRVQEAMSIGV